MTLNEVKNLIAPYVVKSTVCRIQYSSLERDLSGACYNEMIRRSIEAKLYGIYLWTVPDGRIVYCGKAGTVKNDGTYGKHALCNRLVASRGKDKTTKIDESTFKFMFRFMHLQKIEFLDLHVFYTKDEVPPAYVESMVLFNYLKANSRLPTLNKSF
ncbi:hypothetical protein [Flaviaesturariibacter aridisoli]|uniref:GIY-YIG domain-containing protein n=1 Tax=Flaviaesturariibacter aridisoli TaxID=2545761 RepID=A0A4R4E242_9BACT|nr:hypothetical protein [Flaviaesturariibacter aridisoli]TCZ73459.1 hypothetical protein E0486_05730 [Flaviaesturariibacter aridisoli]